MAEVEQIVNPSTRLEALRSALDTGSMRPAKRMINALHPAEVASLIESLRPAERQILWELVPADNEGDILLGLNDEVRASIIATMDDEEIVAAADGMELDDLADFLTDLPEAIIQQVMHSMDQQHKDRLQTVLAYPEDCAGGLMNPDTVTVRPDVSIEVVLRYLRLSGGVPDKTDALFVVNRNDLYLGTLPLTSLLTADPSLAVSEVMESDPVCLLADTSAAQVAMQFSDRDLLSAAVVDQKGQLLGRITIDDVVDVIREQGEHSLMSMAGLDEDEDMFAPVFSSARRRAVWLGVNLATAFLASWVVGLFQATLDQVVILAILMPIVASMGGIAGSQTLTLMIRGIALGQVEKSNSHWLLNKEIMVGLLNGLAWASIVAVAVILWFGDWRIGVVIAVALIINLVVAAVSGVGIPLLLRRLGVDPALAGSVVLTTFTDVIGFAAFLGLGTLILL